MKFPNIALVGEAGSGKTTLADQLVRHHKYVRVSLADPVKIAVGRAMLGDDCRSDLEAYAFVKAHKEEIRPVLQALGVANRQVRGEDYWIKLALARAEEWNRVHNRPVVVDDCRFLNEAAAFRERGLCIVRVDRDWMHRGATNTPTLTAEQRQHVSEAEMWSIRADFVVFNQFGPSDLLQDLLSCLSLWGDHGENA